MSIATHIDFETLADLDEGVLETYLDVLDEMNEEAKRG